MIEDAAKTSQVSPRHDKSQIGGQDRGKTTWTDFQAMLDAHERAAWLEGYKAAKLEIIKSKVMEKGE